MIDEQHVHDYFFLRCWVPRPEGLVAECLWNSPLRFLREIQDFLVLSVKIQTIRHILEISITVVASAAAVGGVACCIVLMRPRGVDSYGVGIRHDDIGT